jgi:hypothetical protein
LEILPGIGFMAGLVFKQRPNDVAKTIQFGGPEIIS